ncbi:unnamed protein product [Rodentolepis nana]|uniref:Elongin-C n=1 Tax=Rodentolepis nana TaxID=102285 RepID=A0A0R3TMR1_RODNA|nr:unnamed protein product [Rodentolepis nana]
MSSPNTNELQQLTIYEGIEGPKSEYVKLISSDGFEFVIKRKYANVSETINAMLSGPGRFGINEENTILLSQIPSYILDQVCKYFSFKEHYGNTIIANHKFPISPEASFELLMAANFLNC